MRRLVSVLATVALLLPAAACGDDAEPAANDNAGGTPDKVTVGVIPILDVAPIYLGKEKGIFSKHNI